MPKYLEHVLVASELCAPTLLQFVISQLVCDIRDYPGVWWGKIYMVITNDICPLRLNLLGYIFTHTHTHTHALLLSLTQTKNALLIGSFT